MHVLYDKWFTPATAFAAEGNRCGIATCLLCGAAILIDSRDPVNTLRLHAEWHMSKGEKEPQ